MSRTQTAWEQPACPPPAKRLRGPQGAAAPVDSGGCRSSQCLWEICGTDSGGGRETLSLLGCASALPNAGGTAEADAVDRRASASVATLSVLYKATTLYEALVQDKAAVAISGDENEARFLKGLRLGPSDTKVVHQYAEMGLWRRISCLVILHAIYTSAFLSDSPAAPCRTN